MYKPKKGEVPWLMIYVLLLIIILFFKPEQLYVLNSVLGKMAICVFIIMSAYVCGPVCGVISVLISVIALHNVYEGFEEDKEKKNKLEGFEKENENENENEEEEEEDENISDMYG